MRTHLNIIADHYAASTRQDTAAMMADVAPDVRWTEMAGFPCAGTWVGPEQVIEQVFQALGAAWTSYRFELQELIDAGDRVIALGVYHGTYGKTGKSMQARVAHVWRLENGKMVQFEQFTDTLLVAQAMT
ncbi:nuclear transport factor 2 family protein [Polaromonas sp.]|uniref:nuclear transport factor 2 family protein n=1 Tax=Polaromonas sp. TaxID=1869339 RepID=UPI002488426B|nr:nuclear transport factor 2 family protein [Polaromonas sp.]MDI1273607.1 nuclear transport factor 2 family protein [Polaromonas sp.]